MLWHLIPPVKSDALPVWSWIGCCFPHTHSCSPPTSTCKVVLLQLLPLLPLPPPESVFAACASGQLPPWVRHVVLNHAEYIELLPPHLAVTAGAWSAAGGKGQRAVGEGTDVGATTADSACGSSEHHWEGMPTLHPVIWFRCVSRRTAIGVLGGGVLLALGEATWGEPNLLPMGMHVDCSHGSQTCPTICDMCQSSIEC